MGLVCTYTSLALNAWFSIIIWPFFPHSNAHTICSCPMIGRSFSYLNNYSIPEMCKWNSTKMIGNLSLTCNHSRMIVICLHYLQREKIQYSLLIDSKWCLFLVNKFLEIVINSIWIDSKYCNHFENVIYVNTWIDSASLCQFF